MKQNSENFDKVQEGPQLGGHRGTGGGTLSETKKENENKEEKKGKKLA